MGPAGRTRAFGAALGAATGPAAGFGATYAGLGDARLHVWVIAAIAGAALGALTWPVFTRAAPAPTAADDPAARSVDAPTAASPGLGFAALFGFTVGLLAGAFAAFPMGAAMGAIGGALAGPVVAAIWRLEPRLGLWPTVAVTVVGGGAAGALTLLWWTQ